MSIVRFVQSYPTDTGFTADWQTNTMHFESALDSTAIQAAIWGEWTDFLAVIDDLMDGDIFAASWPAEFFDMADPEPRIPIGTATFSPVLTVGESLPLECSMVVSYAGPEVSGVNAARRRGRIYLPTFNNATTSSSGGRVTYSTATRNTVRTAFSTFCNALIDLPTPVYLVVYSPTTHAGGSSLFDSVTTVTRGWIDSEIDTQRRRGNVGLGVRETFTVA